MNLRGGVEGESRVGGSMAWDGRGRDDGVKELRKNLEEDGRMEVG